MNFEKGINLYRDTLLLKKRYWALFIPTLVAEATAQLTSIADSVLVGQILGPTEMAAVNMASPVQQLIYAFAVLLCVGATARMAICMGERNKEEAEGIFSTVVFLEIVVGIILTVVLFLCIDGIVSMLTNSVIMKPLLADYLGFSVFGAVPFMVFTAFCSVARTDGMAGVVMTSSLVSQVVNVVLDIVLMKHTDMGLGGASLATLCGYISGAIILCVWYLMSKKRTLKLKLSALGYRSKLRRRSVDVVASGAPTALGILLISIKMIILYRIVQAAGGVEGAKVYSVSLPLQSISSILVASTAGAMMPIIGCLWGERDFNGVRMLTKYALVRSMLIQAGLSLLIIIFPAMIFGSFNMESEVVDFGRTALRLYAVSLIGFVATFVMMYYYTTIQKKTAALLLNSVEGFFALIPLAWLMSKWWGVNGMFAAFIFAELAGFLVLYLYSKISVGRKTRYPDLYLIDGEDSSVVFDVSAEATPEYAVQMSRSIQQVLTREGISEDTAIPVAVVLEDTVLSLSRRAEFYKRPVHMDLRVLRGDTGIAISFRDDSTPMDPLNLEEDNISDETYIHSVALVKALAKDIRVDRHISLNHTMLIL